MVSPENHAAGGVTDRVHCNPDPIGANCANQELAMSTALFRPSNSLRTVWSKPARPPSPCAARWPARSNTGPRWATLGQIVEHTGLSVQEARSAIEQYEAAARAHRYGSSPHVGRRAHSPAVGRTNARHPVAAGA